LTQATLLKRRRVADPFVYIRLAAVVISPWRGCFGEHPRSRSSTLSLPKKRSTTTFRTILGNKGSVGFLYPINMALEKDCGPIKALIDMTRLSWPGRMVWSKKGLCTFF
jgi:hypothetical protein